MVDLDAGDINLIGGGEDSAPPDLVVGNPRGSSGAAKKLDQARKTGMKFIARKASELLGFGWLVGWLVDWGMYCHDFLLLPDTSCCFLLLIAAPARV